MPFNTALYVIQSLTVNVTVLYDVIIIDNDVTLLGVGSARSTSGVVDKISRQHHRQLESCGERNQAPPRRSFTAVSTDERIEQTVLKTNYSAVKSVTSARSRRLQDWN